MMVGGKGQGGEKNQKNSILGSDKSKVAIGGGGKKPPKLPLGHGGADGTDTLERKALGSAPGKGEKKKKVALVGDWHGNGGQTADAKEKKLNPGKKKAKGVRRRRENRATILLWSKKLGKQGDMDREIPTTTTPP